MKLKNRIMVSLFLIACISLCSISSVMAIDNESLIARGYPAINPKIAEMAPLVLEVWLPADIAPRQPMKDVLALFEEAYPNVKLEVNGSIPWEEIPAKVKLAVNSGAAPDLSIHHPFVAGAQGFAEPLDDLWAEWGAQDEFLEGGLLDSTWLGTMYGVPFNVTSICLLYNSKLYEEAGIEAPPTTLEELVEVSKKLTNIDKYQYGFACYANPWGMFGLVAANGSDLIVDGKANLTDEIVLNTLDTYIKIATQDGSSMIPPAQESQAEVASALFGTGRAAQFITGTWDFSVLREQYPDVWEYTKVAPCPGTTDSCVLGGGGCFVPLGAKNREVAFELMKWFTCDEFAVGMVKDYGQFPPKKHQLEDPYFAEDMLQPFLNALPNARPYLLEAFPETADAFEQAVRGGFDGADFRAMMFSAQEIAVKELAAMAR